MVIDTGYSLPQVPPYVCALVPMRPSDYNALLQTCCGSLLCERPRRTISERRLARRSDLATALRQGGERHLQIRRGQLSYTPAGHQPRPQPNRRNRKTHLLRRGACAFPEAGVNVTNLKLPEQFQPMQAPDGATYDMIFGMAFRKPIPTSTVDRRPPC